MHLKFRALKKRIYIDLVVRPMLHRATTLISLTETEVDNYRALGVRTPCAVVPNGIDPAAYRQHPGPQGESHWRIPDRAQVVLILGRVHPLKGEDRLLEAFLQICPSF